MSDETISGTESVSATQLRLFIERIRRDGEVIDAQPETVLRAGDVVAVIAARETMVRLLAGVADTLPSGLFKH